MILRTTGFESSSAAMWDCARRFGKQQAVFRSRWKDPPSTALFGDRVIVLLRIKAQQRQLKTTLAACLPVTWPTVASQLCKYGLQVVWKSTTEVTAASSSQTVRTAIDWMETTVSIRTADESSRGKRR